MRFCAKKWVIFVKRRMHDICQKYARGMLQLPISCLSATYQVPIGVAGSVAGRNRDSFTNGLATLLHRACIPLATASVLVGKLQKTGHIDWYEKSFFILS